MQKNFPANGVWISMLLHACLFAGFYHFGHKWIAPMLLPGDAHGTRIALVYLPGHSAPQSSLAAPAPPHATQQPTRLPTRVTSQPKQAELSSNTKLSPSNTPTDKPGEDALGSGDVNIALAQFFPSPKPDLSRLPKGTTGDVILDAVIDANGKIAKLTMTRGLGFGIDEAVLATVQQWTFKPATRNGTPVSSEQELHFHYERG